MARRCGLLGKTLKHSYSPAIHAQLGDYAYVLYEKQAEELEAFLKHGDWDGLNVTIPYKKAVLPYLDDLSDTAKKVGSVNTIVRKEDGTLYGDNTDFYGFTALVQHSGIEVTGKKTLVLGNGGAAAAVIAALEAMGALVTVISRKGEDNYGNLDRHADAEVIVNTTPLGMYPENGTAAVRPARFPCCCGVIDIVYNPCRTALLLEAEQKGIPCAGGLYMLAAQAKRSAELFSGSAIDDGCIERIARNLALSMQNIVLVGMPGCGKSTVAAVLAALTGKRLCDSDLAIAEQTGSTPAELILREGEPAFRQIECEVLSSLGKQSGAVIATGGGAVLMEQNYAALHQNGILVWLTRDLSDLSRKGRPLSQGADLTALYAVREPRYRRFADVSVAVQATPEETAAEILRVITSEVKL